MAVVTEGSLPQDRPESAQSSPSTRSGNLSSSEPSTRLTTPNSENSGSDKAMSDHEDGTTSKYGTDLPRVPDANDGKILGPLSIDAGTPDAWVARDERM